MLEIFISISSKIQILLTIDNPNPVPLTSGCSLGSDLKNGSKTLLIFSFEIPIPLSKIETIIVESSLDKSILISPFWFEYFNAFEIKLPIIIDIK